MNRRGFLLSGATLLSALPLADQMGGWDDALAETPASDPAGDPAGSPALALRIAYPDKSPPSSWQNVDHRMQGLLVDIMADVAATTGYAFRPLPRPLPRVQLEVESGAADGMCLVVTPARLEYAAASAEPLMTGPITMFARRDNPALERLKAVRSLDDLARADITVIAFTGNGWIKRNVEDRGIRTEHASGTVGTVRMLLAKRGDVIVDMSSQINWILKSVPGASDVVELPTVIERVDWHLLISKRSPALRDLPRFDQAIRALKTSPRYAEMLRKYGMDV
nr:transporter substrate-binding domain-containing protein [uncultured Dongia sp.]